MMTRRDSAEQVAVLADAEKLEIAADDGRRLAIDHRELLERAVGGRQLVEAMYFGSTYGMSSEVVSAVECAGFEVRRTAERAEAWIAVEADALVGRCDVVIFLGADDGVEPVVTLIQGCGLRAELWSWWEMESRRVREVADLYVGLAEGAVARGQGGETVVENGVAWRDGWRPAEVVAQQAERMGKLEEENELLKTLLIQSELERAALAEIV